MQLQLKEEPKEWFKFTVVMAVATMLVAFVLHRREVIGREALHGIGLALALVLGVCALRPRWFRGFYRAGMTASWHVGQVMGRVLLTLFFLVVLTPLGLVLRLLGKDLLEIRPRRDAATYWKNVERRSDLDRMF